MKGYSLVLYLHFHEYVLPILYADAEFYCNLTPKNNKSAVLIAANLAKTLFVYFFITLKVFRIYLMANQIQ